MRFTLDKLSNGFILLTDRECQWEVCFNADGTYAHGGAGSHSRSMPEMLSAVNAFIKSQRGDDLEMNGGVK